MNKKLKLFTLLSTLTTTAIEPIGNLANSSISGENNNFLQKFNAGTLDLKSSGGNYDLVADQPEITYKNVNPFIGHVKSDFDNPDETTYDNASYTSIRNEDYLIVPYWNIATNKAHYDAFASYIIDRETQVLTLLSENTKLGYDVSNSVLLKPHVIGENLITFSRAWTADNQYGKGEWVIGITNIKSGSYSTMNLNDALEGMSTANFRNIYLSTVSGDNPKIYLNVFDYQDDKNANIRVWELPNFDINNKIWQKKEINNINISESGPGRYPGTKDVIFGDDFATPKHEYINMGGREFPLLGWTNLFNPNDIKPINIDFDPSVNARGYWLNKTSDGLAFLTIGDNGGDKALLQIGFVDSNNNAAVSSVLNFPKDSIEFDFYGGVNISLNFFKGFDETYYIIPNGIKNFDSFSSSKLPDRTNYFAFNVANKDIINLAYYNWNLGNNLFRNADNFKGSKLNYIVTTGVEMVANTHVRDIIKQQRFQTFQAAILDTFSSFLNQNLFFIDLSEVYNSGATDAQKTAIENVASWIGKKGDYTFAPMSLTELQEAAKKNLPDTVTIKECFATINNFISIQRNAAQKLITATYYKWISTIEGDPLGHQWGWYNEENLSNIFPGYVISDTLGLIYLINDNDITNPFSGLQRVIDEFKSELFNNNPTRFLDKYFNLQAGSDIEKAFNEYKDWGKKQLTWYYQKISNEFNTFYYGFKDVNDTQDKFWNYFLNPMNFNLLENVDELINHWKSLMKTIEYDKMTALNFFFTTHAWESMNISSWGGKDAAIEDYPFDYSKEFQSYKDINLNTFDQIVSDFYDNFLKTQYFGYSDTTVENKYDISQYFTVSDGNIITKNEFIAKFQHNSNFYNYFSTFYTWTPTSTKYISLRNLHFTKFLTTQDESLKGDFQEIVKLLENYYYGYLSMSGNKLTTYLFSNLLLSEELNVVNLINNFKSNPPTSAPDFLGNWSTKLFLEQFKQADSEIIVSWRNDQLDKLNNNITTIIDEVKNDYYGWITKAGEPGVISKIDNLLANFGENVELTRDAIVATIKIGSLPIGIASLYQVASFLSSIDDSEVQQFKNNQITNFTLEFNRIMDPIIAGYYGYPPSDSLSDNIIVKTILSNHLVNTEITILQAMTDFKTGIAEGRNNFPKIHQVANFLTEIKDQITEFVNDQDTQFTNYIKGIISNLIWGYFGYEPSSSLSDNYVSKTILTGHTPGTSIDESIVMQIFKDGIANKQSGFPDRFTTNEFLAKLLDNDGDVTNYIFDQTAQLHTKFTEIISWITSSWYGSLASSSMVDNYIYKYILAGQKADEQLDSDALLQYLKDNFPKGDSNLAGQWAVKTFLDNITQDSKAVTDFIADQNNSLQIVWTTVLSRIVRNFFGYSTGTNSLISRTILNNVLDGEELDVSKLFEKFKENVIAKKGAEDFPQQYFIHKWFTDLISSSEINNFIAEQNTKLREGVDTIINGITTSYWGYGSGAVPESILNGFFDDDKKSILSTDNAITKVIKFKTRDDGSKSYHVFNYLKGIIDGDLTTFMDEQIKAAKVDLTNIMLLLNKYYLGFEYDFSLSNEAFVGSKHISLFFKQATSFTSGLPSTIDELYNLVKTQLASSDIITDSGKNYSSVSTYLTSLFTINGDVVEPAGELLNYKIWAEKQQNDAIDAIAQNYFDNYYGYATGDDLNNLNIWFGTQGTSMLSLDQLKTNMLNHTLTLQPADVKDALDNFSLLLGTSTDQITDNTILARDLKAAINDVNSINQSWRNDYYGITGYTGTWFESKYDITNNNWMDVSTRSDLGTVRTSAVNDSNKFVMEYVKVFVSGSTNLLNFKTFQETEISKILQPIVDFYNQWYMGYPTTESYLLETTNSSIANGWVYLEVLNKISITIVKNNDTRSWESQYINSTYVSSTSKAYSYRDEQMNSLVSDVNDNFIGTFLKNNYYGYNFGTSIPPAVSKILSWQNNTNLEAIWDIATWNGNDWTSTNAATYKIFLDIDNQHGPDLALGKHFNNKLATYSSTTSGEPGAEFANFQQNALSTEVTSLITKYQAAYFGYTSKTDINLLFLPGMIETTNGNINWVLSDVLAALKADPGNFQNADRLTNGKWLHNGSLVKITTNLTQDDNFTAKERNAFEADVNQIINEYKNIFRGFVNDVNGNKLSFKTLGGDGTLDNGVFIRTSSDVTSGIFDQNALITYIHTFHNSSITPTWEANIISDYRGNQNEFKNEQNNIYRGYLEEVNKKYSSVSQGYFATFNGSSLSFPNLPGWVTGPTGATIDIDLAMTVLDRETYNQMISPSSSAVYRLSYDAWKFYEDNVQNFANEQTSLSSKDLAATEKGFKRQTEIFNFLADSESNKSWKTEPNYRGNYQNLAESKQALANFLNQVGNPTSVADLNEISSQWFSLTQGDESTDWNNTNLKHTFLFFSQYGMPLQLIYEPTNPKLLGAAKISATIVELDSGQHLLNGEVDSITFSPTSQDGNVVYGPTLVITKGFQQFTYKIIPSNNKFPFDQLLFTVADTSSGTPIYNSAQKITIAKNLDTPNSTENSVAAIEYDKSTFSFSNESPNYDGVTPLPFPDESGKNKINAVYELHHSTKAVRDIYIQIGVGHDLATGRKIRTNISIMSPDYNNQVLSIDEVIARLPHITPPSETSSLPSWVVPVITVVAAITVIGPIIFFTIRKIRSRSITGKTLKKHVELKSKQNLLKKRNSFAKNKMNTSFLFKNKKM